MESLGHNLAVHDCGALVVSDDTASVRDDPRIVVLLVTVLGAVLRVAGAAERDVSSLATAGLVAFWDVPAADAQRGLDTLHAGFGAPSEVRFLRDGLGSMRMNDAVATRNPAGAWARRCVVRARICSDPLALVRAVGEMLVPVVLCMSGGDFRPFISPDSAGFTPEVSTGRAPPCALPCVLPCASAGPGGCGLNNFPSPGSPAPLRVWSCLRISSPAWTNTWWR